MKTWKLSLSVIAAPLFFIFILATCAAESGSSSSSSDDDGQLYSPEAVDEICSIAQGIVAATDIVAKNTIFNEWGTFLQSNAMPDSMIEECPAPWNPIEYNPNGPLTTMQHVVYDISTNSVDLLYPKVVSCKMKSADYLKASDLDSDAETKPCRDVHEYYVEKVIESLTLSEAENLQAYVIDDDEEDNFRWSSDNPYHVLYRKVADGPIHVKSQRLQVDPCPEEQPIPSPPAPEGVTVSDVCGVEGSYPNNGPWYWPNGDEIPFRFFRSACEPRKWGVQYCHLATPEYIREAFTGGAVDVPLIPDT